MSKKRIKNMAIKSVLFISTTMSIFNPMVYAESTTLSDAISMPITNSWMDISSLSGAQSPDWVFPKWLKETYDAFLSDAKGGKLPSGKTHDYAKELEFANATFVSDALGWFDTEYWYKRSTEYLSSKTDKKSASFLAFMRENEWFFRIVMYGIKRKEYNNPIRNPWNNQGQFQLFKIEYFIKSQQCDNDSTLYNSCAVVLDLYKASKNLTEEENLLQYLDFVWFVRGKFRWFDSYYSGDNQYSAKIQSAILISMLGAQAEPAEIEALMADYDFRTRKFTPDPLITTMFERNKQIFQSVAISDVQSLWKIPEVTFWNSLWTLYNGVGNAGSHGNYGKFVWDNWYPCNNEDAWFQFFQIRCDGCTAVSLQAGLGSTVWALKSASDVWGYEFHTNVLRILRSKLNKLAKM